MNKNPNEKGSGSRGRPRRVSRPCVAPKNVAHLPEASFAHFISTLQELGFISLSLDYVSQADVTVKKALDFTTNTPIYYPYRCLAHLFNEVVNKEHDKIFDADIIKPISSPWCWYFPTVIGTKKTGSQDLRGVQRFQQCREGLPLVFSEDTGNRRRLDGECYLHYRWLVHGMLKSTIRKRMKND